MVSEFRDLKAKLRPSIGVASPSPYIVKPPGGSFGATMTFEHRGPAATVWVGIGLAYGIFIGHNPPFCYAMTQFPVGEDLDWKSYSVDATGTIPTNVQLGKLIDAQKFISDTQPVIDQQPPNPYGINDWDDEVYATMAPTGYRALTASYR